MSERLVCRLTEVKFTAGDGATGAAIGTFEGYGSVFGTVDWYGDVVAKGAFRDTLKAWRKGGKWPPMLLQHGGGGFFGGGAIDQVPVGTWTEMREDDTGLYVAGRLIALDTERGKTVHAAMLEGGLDGLSIGYRAKKYTVGTKPDEPVRTLEAVDLVEVSVVTFPANPEARVSDVKGIGMTEREFEAFLREAGGFTRDHAKAITAKGFRTLRREAESDEEALAHLLRTIEATTAAHTR